MPLLTDRNQPARLSRAGGLRLACGLVLVGSGVIWLSLQEPRGQRRTLAGVAEIELTGATYGTRHEHWDGNFWQRLGFNGSGWRNPRSPPPNSHQRNLSPYRELTTPSDALVLWFRARSLSSSQSSFWDAVTVDSHGCVAPCSGEASRCYLPALIGFDGAVARSEALEVEIFPRRDAAFRYAISSQLHPDLPRLEFRIVNPAPLKTTRWSAPACPVSVDDGDTRFVLRSLRHLQTDGSVSRSEAVFECYEKGKRVNTWRPDRITLSDATGNLLEPQRESGPPDRITFESLCRFEPGWKLRVRFARSNPEVTPPDFTWSPPVMPAPVWGAYADSTASATFDDLRLRLTRVVGGGKMQLPGGSGDFSCPIAELAATGPPGKYQLSLLHPKLKSGPSSLLSPWQRSQVLDSNVFTPSDLADSTFPLGGGPLSQRRLRLTFAVHRTRTVEFLVQP